jgi:hypothetical protein
MISCSAACSVAMFWAICSCFVASCSTLFSKTARSRATWYDYGEAANVFPIEAQAYLTWYAAVNIEKLNPDEPREPYEIEFPNVRTMSRVEQKRMLNDSITRARGKTEVMSDPQTERRPQVLDWP